MTTEIELNVDKFRTIYDWIILSEHDDVSMIATGDLPDYYESLTKSFAINYHCYDYDPKFKNNPRYTVCDVIFDSPQLNGLLVNFNAQKMYPIGKIYNGEMIVIGSDFKHNGDCNVITSCEQLVEQNNLHTVYKMAICNHYGYDIFNHNIFMVWGRND